MCVCVCYPRYVNTDTLKGFQSQHVINFDYEVKDEGIAWGQLETGIKYINIWIHNDQEYELSEVHKKKICFFFHF